MSHTHQTEKERFRKTNYKKNYRTHGQNQHQHHVNNEHIISKNTLNTTTTTTSPFHKSRHHTVKSNNNGSSSTSSSSSSLSSSLQLFDNKFISQSLQTFQTNRQRQLQEGTNCNIIPMDEIQHLTQSLEKHGQGLLLFLSKRRHDNLESHNNNPNKISSNNHNTNNSDMNKFIHGNSSWSEGFKLLLQGMHGLEIVNNNNLSTTTDPNNITNLNTSPLWIILSTILNTCLYCKQRDLSEHGRPSSSTNNNNSRSKSNSTNEQYMSLVVLTSSQTHDCFHSIQSRLSILQQQLQLLLQLDFYHSPKQQTLIAATVATNNRIHCCEQSLKQLVTITHCLRDFIIAFGKDLHSENHVSNLVQNNIIPLLEVLDLSSSSLISLKGGAASSSSLSSLIQNISFNDQQDSNHTTVSPGSHHTPPLPMSNNDDSSNNIHLLHLELYANLLECIHHLILWKQHASALLASLVLDVSMNGRECTEQNPLRSKLLKAVSSIFTNDNSSTTSSSSFSITKPCNFIQQYPRLVFSACNCLVVILDGIRMVENKVKSSSSQLDNETNMTNKTIKKSTVVGVHYQMNTLQVLRWIHECLQNDNNTYFNLVNNSNGTTSLRWCCLSLLCSVIKMYPQISAQQWLLFLPEPLLNDSQISSSSPSNKTNNTLKQRNGCVTLLSISCLHDHVEPKPTDMERVQASIAIKELLTALPLRLWLTKSKRLSNISHRNVNANITSSASNGYLRSKVMNTLLHIIDCIQYQLSQPQSYTMTVELCEISKYIILNFPFDVCMDVGDDELLRSATLLLHELSEAYMLKRSSVMGLNVMAKVLADCMGGLETPQGTRTPLPLPTKMWLIGNSSRNFIHDIFQSVSCVDSHTVLCNDNSLEMGKVNLLMHMIRSVIWIVLQDQRRREMFEIIVRKFISKVDLRLYGVKFIQSFVQGKSDFICSEEYSSSDELLAPFTIGLISGLDAFLYESSDSTLRRCLLTTYGSLQLNDWVILLQDHSNPCTKVLPLCLEYSGENDASVRTEACRAVGNITSVCMSYKTDYSEESTTLVKAISRLIEESIQVTYSAIVDSNAGVRSMALFTIGNIASALVDFAIDQVLLSKLSLMRLCEDCLERLDDSDDKVIGNAVRTIGHLLYLLYNHKEKISMKPQDDIQWTKLIGIVSEKLGLIIKVALEDVTTSSTHRSWKQRSFAKKHAWGACQSLSPLLSCGAARDFLNNEGLETAISQLIKCVELADVVNEKISLGAISTLRKIPELTWEYASKRKNLIGQCLSACLSHMYSTNVTIELKEEMNLIMLNLIPWATQDDINICLQTNHQQDISSKSLNSLYGWMVDQQTFESECFRKIALAMEQSEFYSDVSLMQKFRSRAVYEERSNIMNDENEDDEL